jgi:hypothetical protein
MKPNFDDEIADRAAEERSEDDGMPEHPAKACDPAKWTAERRVRSGQRAPEQRRPSAGARPRCVSAAGAGARAVTPPARLPR